MNKEKQTDKSNDNTILFISILLLFFQFMIISHLLLPKNSSQESSTKNQKQENVLSSVNIINTGRLNTFFNEYKNSLLKLANKEANYAIDDHINAFFVKDGIIELNIKDVNVPADNLIFEGYYYEAEEYPIAFRKHQLTVPNLTNISPQLEIITQDLAKITFHYSSTELINRDMYDFLHEALSLSYQGRCSLEIISNIHNSLKIKSSLCELSITGNKV
jgi:hypothetical protein